MAQFHLIANDTKRQLLSPKAFGDGARLLEFGISGCGVMCGLAVLLAQDNKLVVGDLNSSNPLIGSWSGDHIRIVGDYGPPLGQIPGNPNYYKYAQDNYEDISQRVVRLLCVDDFLRRALATSLKHDLDTLEPRTKDALGFTAIQEGRWQPVNIDATQEQLEEQQRQTSPLAAIRNRPEKKAKQVRPDLSDESMFHTPGEPPPEGSKQP